MALFVTVRRRKQNPKLVNALEDHLMIRDIELRLREGLPPLPPSRAEIKKKILDSVHGIRRKWGLP